MSALDKTFQQKVYALVALIPEGRVMTYGQIAALCGQPRAARIVGQIAHFGPSELPWQRVIKKSGDLANGFPGGKNGHKAMLEQEGITFVYEYVVDITEHIYYP
jgi:methylated-DNA-protein-cysteine methyltransferase-like protein